MCKLFKLIEATQSHFQFYYDMLTGKKSIRNPVINMQGQEIVFPQEKFSWCSQVSQIPNIQEIGFCLYYVKKISLQKADCNQVTEGHFNALCDRM